MVSFQITRKWVIRKEYTRGIVRVDIYVEVEQWIDWEQKVIGQSIEKGE